jgi:hypothetical protein
MDSSQAKCWRDRCIKWAAIGLLLAIVAGARAADSSLGSTNNAGLGADTLGRGAPAGNFSFESAGARFGAGASSSNRDFHQAEAFVDWNLPWHWDLGKKWDLASRLGFSAGWLGNNHSDGAVGTLGPLLALGRERFPISIEGGAGLTLISRWEFETKNFGEPVQFTSYMGLGCDLAKDWRFGYRFQHMSNAGISQSNPGLNLHVLAFSYRF